MKEMLEILKEEEKLGKVGLLILGNWEKFASGTGWAFHNWAKDDRDKAFNDFSNSSITGSDDSWAINEWIVDGDKPVMYALLDKAEKDKKEP